MRRRTRAYRSFIRQRLADALARREDFLARMRDLRKHGVPDSNTAGDGLMLTYAEAVEYFNFLDECCEELVSEEAHLRGLLRE